MFSIPCIIQTILPIEIIEMAGFCYTFFESFDDLTSYTNKVNLSVITMVCDVAMLVPLYIIIRGYVEMRRES